MPTTCKLIAKTVLGSSANTMDFQNIPGTYDDLLILVSARVDYSDSYGYGAGNLKINNSGSSIYSNRRLVAYSSVTASFSGSNATSFSVVYGAANSTSNTFSNQSIYIPNYAGSTNKSLSSETVIENNVTDNWFITLQAFLWASTDAITRVTFDAASGNFVANSSAFIYGIKKS